MIARVCNERIPESQREGSPFELTLQSWLQLFFQPTFKRIVKEKKSNLGKKNL